jgi:diaminopimelate decarboxylase
MNAILRPSLYGAQHPIEVINDSKYLKDYVVVGPCCESGDILTPAPGDPEEIQPRQLKAADTGDIVAIGAVGAYCASMSANRYNDIPPATEIIL